MALFWFPRKRSPQKAYDSRAQWRTADVPCFAPAVGVTSAKEEIMTRARNNKTPTATHTPLPWQVFDALGEFEIAIVTRRTPPMTRLVEFHAHPNAKADAAFIVKACNNYYHLLAAAKNTLEYLPGQEKLQLAAIISDAEKE
jgi:hypothetical protein